MNALHPWKEGLTIIGQNAMLFFVAFLIVKEISLRTIGVQYFYKCNFSACQSFFSLCVACVDGLPMQIGKQGGGMDLLVFFKIVNIVVSIKTRHLVQPERKAQ